jgi:predicted lactoylglutathione lyase
MINAVFLNMPVQDVARSKAFFSNLGFGVNEQFSGLENVCIVVNQNISLMLMDKRKFSSFIDKSVAPKETSEVILSFACDSEAEVRSITEKALALGARKVNEAEDTDFMFSWAFEDLDGHLWDLFWIKA